MGFPFVVLLVIPGIIHGKALMSIARKMRTEYNKASFIAEQAISSVRSVYSFVGERGTISAYSAALQGTVKLGLRQGLAKGLVIGSSAIVFGIWAFMSYYGSRMVMYHGADGGTVYAIGSAFVTGGITLGSGLSNLKAFSEATAAGEQILELINRVPKIDSDSTEGRILHNISGEVEFIHVEFAYPSRPDTIVLKDLNLKIPQNSTMALVGESGCGKSTLISLLQRFYDPCRGEILIDGVDIRKLNLKWLRLQMGLVSQEPALFATTIRENIVFGKEGADMDEVVEAAKASNAHDFICQLPRGYDTQVGERGIQMSGGQKQRIAIARAIIRAPRVLLLDEATSALDSSSEHIVQEALEKAYTGRTTIIIAHNLSTIRNANLIAVISKGHVIETGSHDELIRDENSLYSSLIKLQATKEGKKEDTSSNIVIVEGRTENKNFSLESLVTQSSSRRSIPLPHVDNHKTKKDRRVPSFWRLLSMNLPEWKQATIGCTSAALFGAIQPVYGYAMGSMVSVYFLTDHQAIQTKTRFYALCFVGLAILSFWLNICQHYSFAYMGEYLTMRVRKRMLSKILTFEVGWFDRDENSSGSICSWLDRDANMVRSLVGDRMALLIQTLSATIISCTLGLVISWRLAIVIISIQPLLITCLYFKHVLLKSMSKKATKAQEESSKLAAESVSNIRTIWAFSSQAHILKMLSEAQQGPRNESIRFSWFAGIGLGTCQSLWSLTLALDYWYGGKLISENFLSPKALFQTFIVLLSTGRIIADAGIMTRDLSRGSDSVKFVFNVLDRASLIEPESPQGYRPDKIMGQIELQNITFSYPSRPEITILENFTFEIEAGKSSALVGQSGSGKSTIISLIQRFYDPLKGMIKIDGHDLKTFHLRYLREQIALVSQEPILFSSTIRENITYGMRGEVPESEIIKAAKASNAHDFISGLMNGYDTCCGERGVQLSGGQKQRIAIARAILKNPSILLLDEATSALDSQSEKAVQVALERVMVGKTSVLVAHRLSTIQNCDTIAVLVKGKVVEKGNHLSLLAKGSSGAYYSMVRLQRTP